MRLSTLFFALLSISISPQSTIAAISLTHTIPNYKSTCLIENITANELVTMSVFITSGAELRGTATIEGPIAPPDAKTGKDIDGYMTRYKNGERYGKLDKEKLKDPTFVVADRFGNVKFSESLNFEDVSEDVPYSYDDDHWYMDDEEMESEHVVAMKNMGRGNTEGDPWSKTIRIVKPGWYQACVTGSWYQIDAELEFRKESELGFNIHAERVHTYDEAELQALNNEIDEESAEEQDMGHTKNQLKVLNHMIAGIRDMQRLEKRRLQVHAAVNEHSHSRMVLGSLMETVLFILVTGFQIFTIRKWFQAEPMLGK